MWGTSRNAGSLCDIELGMKLIQLIGSAMRRSQPSFPPPTELWEKLNHIVVRAQVVPDFKDSYSPTSATETRDIRHEARGRCGQSC